MTFSDVTFELADPRHPLCRLPDNVHVVLRLVEAGDEERPQRIHLTIQGPPEAAAAAMRELLAFTPGASLDRVQDAPSLTTAFLNVPPDPARPAPDLHAILPTLDAGGFLALPDPLVATGGRIRGRIVIPHAGDPEDILRALQAMQRGAGFTEFKILRMASITAAVHIETTRRALPVEQESLLALAASMGYYRTPKVVTLEEISRAVGLSISPVHKRLKAAEEAIISQHVAPAATDTSRKRTRNATIRGGAPNPSEMQLQVRGDIGPSRLLAEHPDARASLHPISLDDRHHQSYILVLHAPHDVQEKLLAGLVDRPDGAQVHLADRSATHLVCRIKARDRGPYSLAAWRDAWGDDAPLRAMVFEGDQVYLRALVSRPQTPEELHRRAAACARAALWTDCDIVAVRNLGDGSAPPGWPEPLTQRQIEVLHIAHALGYYKTPRGCTLGNVASTLGVSANAIHKNLVLAESKLIAAYLAAGL